MPLRPFRLVFAAAAALTFSAAPAALAGTPPTVYTSQALWTAATPGVTTVTFENIAPDSGEITASPIVQKGIVFSGTYTVNGNNPVDYGRVYGKNAGAGNLNGTAYYGGGSTRDTSILGAVTATFAPGIKYNAFGTLIGAAQGTTLTLQAELYNGTTLLTNGAAYQFTVGYTGSAAPTFLGFQSDEAFDKVVFRSLRSTSTSPGGGTALFLDNVSVGTVPEPGVFVTALPLVAGVGLMLRRGRKREVTPQVTRLA